MEPFKNRRARTWAGHPQSGLVARACGTPWLALGFALLACFAWPFSVDDAFIAAHYARRLAEGQGYTFRDGPPTDGVTGPLWLLPLWTAARLGFDPMLAAKLCGGALSGLSLWRVLVSARRGAQGRLTATLAVLLCLTSIPFVIWSVAGLETGAAALAATELALAVRARPQPRPGVAGLAIGCLAWLRPELAFWSAAWLVVLASRSRRALVTAVGVAAPLALLVVGFRWTWFGHVLPMSAAAKPPLLWHGLRYLFAASLRVEGVLVALCLLAALRFGGRSARILVAALSAHALAVVLAGGDWMPGMRLFAPVVPIAAWAIATGFVALARRRPALAYALGGSLLLVRGVAITRELVAAREAGANRARKLPMLVAQARAVEGPIVALDVGALAYFTRAPVVDLGGLTEPRIADTPGEHLDKHVDSAWLRGLEPALLVLHSAERPRVDAAGRLRWFRGYSVERRVLQMPWVQQRYRVRQVIEYAPDYFYVLLTRDAHTGS